MPIVDNLFVDLFGSRIDATKQCWTIRHGCGRGKAHIAYMPFFDRSACPTRFGLERGSYIFEWLQYPLWGDRDAYKFHCKLCRRANPELPLASLLPTGFPPPQTRDDCLVLSDYWADRDEPGKAKIWLGWSTYRV